MSDSAGVATLPRETASLVGPDEGCSCAILGQERSDPPSLCGQEVVAELLMGCVHEHTEVDRLCSYHRAVAVAGGLLCTPCWRLGLEVTSFVLAEVTSSGEHRRVLPS